MVKLEDGYIAVDVPGETKFFLNAINQAALKEWLNALNDVIKINKVRRVRQCVCVCVCDGCVFFWW